MTFPKEHKGHRTTPPSSSAHSMASDDGGSLSNQSIGRDAVRQGSEPQLVLPKGCLAAARVENVQYGSPEKYPNKSHPRLNENGNSKTNWTAMLKRYKKKNEGGEWQTRYDLELFHNAFDERNEQQSTKIARFMFGSTLATLQVRMLREINEIQIFHFPNQKDGHDRVEDSFWTFNLPQESHDVFNQGQSFWETFKHSLEKMPLSHLAYANVNRKLVEPDPADPARDAQPKYFTVPVPGDEDWIFPGKLSEPTFLAEFERMCSGVDLQPGPKTRGAKGRKRWAKKQEKARRRQSTSDGVETISSSKRASTEEAGPSKRRRR